MNNSFLECKLSRKYEFRTDFSCNIFNTKCISDYDELIEHTGIKIDTGAQGILIPLQRVAWSHTEIMKLIKYYLKNDRSKRRFGIIKGVESAYTLRIDELLNKTDKYIATFKGLKIKVPASNITIGGISILDQDVFVTPYTTGNILLGTKTLKEWDIHVGTDINTKENVLLACPYNQITDEYLQALESHFSLGTAINSSLLRNNPHIS